jgi:acyl-CoA reductase-like NAD-dependent aldehyde dehydrogenase
MGVAPSTTTAAIPLAHVRETEPDAVVATTARVRDTARDFARASLSRKLGALAEVRARLRDRGLELARLGAAAKGTSARPSGVAEELLAGPLIIQRYVRLLGESLSQIRERGAPLLADDRVQRLPSGEVSVQVMPHTLADRVLFMPYEIHVRLASRVDTADLRAAQAGFYRREAPEGSVAAVLGAGNVASIPALDLLHECFVAGRACVLKMSPVNAYLGAAFEQIFAPISELGGLAIVYGGAAAGKALLGSPYVDHVHVTGSLETHDTIVWGPPGAEREQRMQTRHPLLDKTITSELGNVSPVVVVPGRYSDAELGFVAESIAGMLFNNASFNCNAAKLLVLPKDMHEPITSRLRRWFSEQPPRAAYYPGASERYAALTRSPRAGRVWSGPAAAGQLPWTLLEGLTPDSDAESFTLEPFCPLLSVVEVAEADPLAYLAQTVKFLNEKVWGTLNAMLFVPSSWEGEPRLEAAVERAIDELRYGTVAVNYWPALGYALGTPPWGGHPSATLHDAQSGIGFVHNALMLEHIQKVVLRGPLRTFPKPTYFPSHRQLDPLARGLFELESTGKATALLRSGLYGARG